MGQDMALEENARWPARLCSEPEVLRMRECVKLQNHLGQSDLSPRNKGNLCGRFKVSGLVYERLEDPEKVPSHRLCVATEGARLTNSFC